MVDWKEIEYQTFSTWDSIGEVKIYNNIDTRSTGYYFVEYVKNLQLTDFAVLLMSLDCWRKLFENCNNSASFKIKIVF